MTQITAAETESIVRIVLGHTYNGFGFQNHDELIAGIIETLNNPEFTTPEYEGETEASAAAAKIRETLWNRYSGGGASATATCNLFYSLRREEELGWIRGEAGDYNDDDARRFLAKMLR